MHKDKGGYSNLLRPIQIVLDLGILVVLSYFFLHFITPLLFLISYIIVCWLLIAYSINYYQVYRFTPVSRVYTLLFRQISTLFLFIYAFIGIFDIDIPSRWSIIYFFGTALIGVTIIKIGVFFALKKYRAGFGGNKRNVVVIGDSDEANKLIKFFNSEREYGYRLLETFHNKALNRKPISDSFDYLKQNIVDELYCVLDQLTTQQVNKYIQYSEESGCTLKFIPSGHSIFGTKLKKDYYNYQPVYSIPETVLDNPLNSILKRIFDVVLSLFVIVFILSWLTPLLYIIIKIDSKGPLFYRHMREGFNYNTFECYKFRSLKNDVKNGEAIAITKDDNRVTRVGKFIRKTSIDELPQFINVLFGEMSVVGPRPHMMNYNELYLKTIDKYSYTFRHKVKPGITGLAQVNGYRGPVNNEFDIINRVKYDIFYIENWSLVLDIKIIVDTIITMIKGDDSAF